MTGRRAVARSVGKGQRDGTDLLSIAVALSVFPFFQNALGLKWQQLGQVMQFSRYIAFGIIVLALIKSRGRRGNKNLSFVVAQIVFLLCLSISSVVNSSRLFYVLQLAIYGLTPFFLLAIFSSQDGVSDSLLGGITLACEFGVLLNLLLMLTFPDGIYRTFSSNSISSYYLFGAKNQMVAPVITCMFLSIVWSYKKYGAITVRAALICCICFAELAIGGSGTGMVISAVFVVAGIVVWRGARLKPDIALLVVALVFLLFVVLRVQDLFSILIVDVLHKSLTLSDRTYIWDAAMRSIASHPVFGVGVGSQLTANVHLVLPYLEKDTFAHDTYLDILLMGGVPALISFFSIVFLTRNKYMSIKHVEAYQQLAWLGLTLYLIASVFDIYITNYCMYLLVVAIVCVASPKNTKRNGLE